MSKGKQYSQQFKEDAVRYKEEHPELTYEKAAKDNEGNVPTRGSGNYASDEAKEIARLQKELRDTKDALEILKKAIGILGK